MSGRFVLVALARPRAAWLDRIVQLANSGAVAAEVHKCVGVVDLLGQIGPGRAVSAVILDAGVHGVDRDLLQQLRASGAAVVIVRDPQIPHDWSTLGADATVRHDFSAHELLDTLLRSAQPVSRTEFAPLGPGVGPNGAIPWDGSLVAVLGPGGTGVSTVAAAAAQGLGRVNAGDLGTALVDLCLCAEQAVLHDADPSNPGLLELVDLCRLGSPGPETVRPVLTAIHHRSYDLLPGLRRPRLWTQLRPASTLEALRALRRTYDVVVADLDGDLEGESESGSADVEDRHQLSRIALEQATVVLAVGHSSMKGLHSLTRTIRDAVEFGVDPTVIQPVFNHAASGVRSRAGYGSALAELTEGLGLTSSPVFVPTRDVDDRIRALTPFPNAIVAPITGAIVARIHRRSAAAAEHPVPAARTLFRRRMTAS